MNYIVKDFMVPLSDYATISKGSTLYEAVLALENIEKDKNVDQSVHPHWIVLVLDKDGEVVGKMSQLNVVKALEPITEHTETVDRISKFGFSAGFIAALRDESFLNGNAKDYVYTDPVKMEMKVEDLMENLVENEFIDENTSLNSAAHQLTVRNRLSLLVTREDKVVGVLRLSDVFAALIAAMKKAH
ncbi:MAG: CBS domain-containing protein [Desulfobacteraceae bacterium]|nr:CBS domain-containing protein [Desulfobacteraceae bacterium]